MELITDAYLFEEIRELSDKVVNRERKLPEKIFRDNFKYFLFIDFDEIFTEEFFNKINKFSKNIAESKWCFVVLSPDAKDVFYKHFQKYSVFEVNTDDKYEDYWHIVSEEPIDDPFEAIFYEGRKIIMFSKFSNWGIFIDRNFELGIVAFTSRNSLIEFTNIFGKNNIFTLEEAITNFLVPAYGNLQLIPERIRKELAANYS